MPPEAHPPPPPPPPPPPGHPPHPPPPAEKGLVLRRARKVWALVARRHRRSLVLATLVMAATAAAGTLVPMLLGGLVNTMQGYEPEGIARFPLWVSGIADRLTLVARAPRGAAGAAEAHVLAADDLSSVAVSFLVWIAAAYLLKEAFLVVRRWLVQRTTTQLEKDTVCSLVTHLLKLDLGTLSGERVGALHGRIGRSVDGFVRFVKLGFMDFVPALLTGLFALIAALTLQPMLAVAMALVIPLALFITLRQIKSQKGVRISLARAKEGLDGTIVEQLGGIEYIRAANTQGKEAARIESAAEDRRRRQLAHHVAGSLFDCAKALNEGLFHVGVIAFAIFLAARGTISFGDVLTFSMLFLGVMAPLRDIHRILDDAHESSIQVGDLLALLDTPVDRSFGQVTLREPTFARGAPAIVCRDLAVEFAGRDGKPKRGLDGVSVSIAHGETIGAAGRSGSGKSTWIKSLMRLLHHTSGTAVLGGIPLESLSRDSIGRLFGYVSQIPFVFAGTIRENIAYEAPQATAEQVESAARRAYLHDEIMAMPKGYDTVVAERGHNLSGGQRQRLALARVFLKNPPILILDEGTSALDNISERHVQHALTDARADRTTIMIAHRLTTLKDANRILVFDGGRIAEVGTYGELVEKGGLFAELVRSAQE